MATTAVVNKPTNTKQKEKDVNAKLQLYGIYAGECSRHPLTSATPLTSFLQLSHRARSLQ